METTPSFPSMASEASNTYPAWTVAIHEFAASLCSGYFAHGMLGMGVTLTDKQWNQRYPGKDRPNAPVEPVQPRGKNQAKQSVSLWREDREIYLQYQQAYEKLKGAILASLGPILLAETMDEFNGHVTKTIHDIVTYVEERHGTPKEADLIKVLNGLEKPFESVSTFAGEAAELIKAFRYLKVHG